EDRGASMHTKHHASGIHYLHLGIMTAPMLIAMFAFMHAMVNRLENVYPNTNQFYMAGLMTAPMIIIEFAVMRSMYSSAPVAGRRGRRSTRVSREARAGSSSSSREARQTTLSS